MMENRQGKSAYGRMLTRGPMRFPRGSFLKAVGHSLRPDWKYIGTVQLPPNVWHVFDSLPRVTQPRQKIAEWVEALEGTGRKVKQQTGYWMAQCRKADDDGITSMLASSERSDGTCLPLNAIATCDFVDIQKAVGVLRQWIQRRKKPVHRVTVPAHPRQWATPYEPLFAGYYCPTARQIRGMTDLWRKRKLPVFVVIRHD